MKKSHKIIATSVAIALSGLGATAYASNEENENEDSAEHQAFLKTPISLTKAIMAAEKKTGAKAMSAEFEDEDGTFIYDIELLTAEGEEIEAEVNAKTGSISIEEDDDDDD